MLTGLLIIWALTAFGLWIASVVVPGVRMRSTGGLWLAALVINGLLVWATASLVPDFEVDGFGAALLAALVMALLGIVGFVLAEWLMLGAVNWMMMEHAHGRPF